MSTVPCKLRASQLPAFVVSFHSLRWQMQVPLKIEHIFYSITIYISKTENYDLVTAFAFTVAAGVIIWVYSLGLLVIPSLIMTGRSPPSVNVDKISKIGNRFSLVTAYTGMK